MFSDGPYRFTLPYLTLPPSQKQTTARLPEDHISIYLKTEKEAHPKHIPIALDLVPEELIDIPIAGVWI